jgi:hypothetical protein
MTDMHDARQLDHYPTGSHRIEARNPWVWIRHKGAWRKGAIHCWYVHGDSWMAWMQHDDPAPDLPWARWGLYHYDGATIRRRYAPAATARVEMPAGRHHREQVTTLLRETGYSVEAYRGSGGAGLILMIG